MSTSSSVEALGTRALEGLSKVVTGASIDTGLGTAPVDFLQLTVGSRIRRGTITEVGGRGIAAADAAIFARVACTERNGVTLFYICTFQN